MLPIAASSSSGSPHARALPRSASRRAAARALAVALWLVAGAAPPAEAAPACARIEVFSREGCPHCAAAAEYLARLAQARPELVVEIRDVVADPSARERLAELSRSHGVERPGVPTFLVCDRLVVGFESDATTGRALEALLAGRAGPAAPDEIVAPWLGRLSVPELGLPLFTVLVGLVDGFNPCAVWVLLFLLSLLVNVRDRRRIAAIAGTFVLVSGAAYFTFMAAWLNVLLLIGFSRTAQIALGLLAVGVGAVHVKDFFALHRGVSLGIPERAKPGIYGRVARIVRAENLPAALAGAFVLAVLVNTVELLCTAGLPALYTQVLALRGLSPGATYAYLLLYNLAYVADDALLVAIAVVSLGRRKLQEREGRWLKLLSGAVILALGALLLLRPEWLSA
jgi:glutaredoxin